MRYVERAPLLGDIGWTNTSCPPGYTRYDQYSACVPADTSDFEHYDTLEQQSAGTACPANFNLERVYLNSSTSPSWVEACVYKPKVEPICPTCPTPCPLGQLRAADGSCYFPCGRGASALDRYGKCVTTALEKTCPIGQLYDTVTDTCVTGPTCPTCPTCSPQPTCPTGQLWDTSTGRCITPLKQPSCPTGQLYNTVAGTCVTVLPQPACSTGYLWDTRLRKCVPAPTPTTCPAPVTCPTCPAPTPCPTCPTPAPPLPWFVAMLGGAAALAAVGLGALLGGR
jgi:hypothetical protein